MTAVEFIGPVFITYDSYTDYYFICQLNVTVSGDITAMFDVALTFDGELDLSLPIKTTTTSALEVTFTADDFGQHFGQMVGYESCYLKM